VPDGPGGELGAVAQVPQVVDVAEELRLQERVGDERDGTVLVDGAVVALQARREVRQVVGQLLDHQGSHLAAPDGLRRVVLTYTTINHDIYKPKQPASI